jgi:type IV pilus assembly protein PilB
MYSNEAYLLEQLQESGLLTERDIQQIKNGLKPGESTHRGADQNGVVSDEQVAQTVAVNSGMEYVDLNGFEPHAGLKALVSAWKWRLKYKIAPLGTNQTALQIVVADPYDFETLDALPHVLQPEHRILLLHTGADQDAPGQHLRQ